MKKKMLFAMAVWLLSMGYAMADDKIIINDVTVPKGGTAELPIEFSFDTEGKYQGFQLMLEFPDGISTVKDGEGLPVVAPDVTSLGATGSGKYTIITTAQDGYTLLPLITSYSINGKSGTLITLTLQADESLEPGTTLEGKTTKVMLSDGTSSTYLENFTFNITIGEPDDGRIKFDEASTKLPSYTAGETADIKMTRTIKAGNWSTIVLPFNLTRTNAFAIFGNDVKFAKFSNFVVDYGEDEENVTPLGITINFTSYSIPARGGKLEGGTPVLIKTSKDITDFQLDGVMLTNSVTDVSAKDEYETTGTFTASFVKTTVPADGLFITDNSFWYSTGKTNIKAFRGWFQLGAVLGKETTDWGAAKIAFFVDGLPTSIDGIGFSGNQQIKGAVYTIGGQLVGIDVNLNQLKKGVYIKDGKKLVVE